MKNVLFLLFKICCFDILRLIIFVVDGDFFVMFMLVWVILNVEY